MKQLIILSILAIASSTSASDKYLELQAPNTYPYQDIFRYSKDVSILKETEGNQINCFVEVKTKTDTLRSEPQLIDNLRSKGLSVETCLPRHEAKRILSQLHKS